jgi:poly-gamma-glutamate synthesis protein (capsule biosynthesis protein)
LKSRNSTLANRSDGHPNYHAIRNESPPPPWTLPRLTEAAAAHQRPGDLLIASIHWGSNWGYDGGFDLVHGHSSHHPKDIELYHDKLILYGCGDFINDYEGISSYEEFRGNLVLMYLPHIEIATGRLLSLKMIPMRIVRFQLRRPSPADAEWLHRVLTRESRKLGTEIVLREDGSFMIDRGGTLARA